MLETEEIDDDYFTPVPSTSLASIFGNNAHVEETKENPSLKYTPPQPKNMKSDESKVTECFFACALLGYEWSGNEYLPRGKLGFAILKIVSSGIYNIVLYDSNKTTLSCTSLTSSCEIIIRGMSYISFYDNSRKHWSLCATSNEVSNISDILSNLKVIVKHNTNIDKAPPNPQIENQTTSLLKNQDNKSEKESDTDSSINLKTKASILSRMASMGQSILPPNTFSKDITSDSSDGNDVSNQPVMVRHKPIKSVVKRIYSEKPTLSDPQLVSHPILSANKTESFENHTLYPPNNQLLPASSINNTNTSYGNDFNLLMTEQRINNSELRININRMSDKVDQILDRVKDISISDKNAGGTNLQVELAQKLLLEYENKIKMYEEIIKSKETNTSVDTSAIETQNFEQLTLRQNKVLERNKTKDTEILNLKEEIKLLTNRLDDIIESNNRNENNLLKDIHTLEEVLMLKNEEISKISQDSEQSRCDLKNSQEITNKVKNIMNDTYRAIMANFENNETYSGETIKSIIATVIKQVTIESLNEL